LLLVVDPDPAECSLDVAEVGLVKNSARLAELNLAELVRRCGRSRLVRRNELNLAWRSGLRGLKGLDGLRELDWLRGLRGL